jgi:hypothetical protein
LTTSQSKDLVKCEFKVSRNDGSRAELTRWADYSADVDVSAESVLILTRKDESKEAEENFLREFPMNAIVRVSLTGRL